MIMRLPCVLAGSFALVFLCASFAGAQQHIVWTNMVNATASGNTLQKTAGCDGCQDSGGISQQQIGSGTGGMQFVPGVGPGQETYAGLSHTTATPLNYTQLDYAFAIYGHNPNNVCEIRERGAWKADCTFVAGDVLKISIEAGSVVRYYRNGAAVYASAVVPSDYPYVLGADLFNIGTAIGDAAIMTPSLTYLAITDRTVYPKPVLPSLGPAGWHFVDPTFGSRMMRVTDTNTRPGYPGRSLTAPSAAHQLAWNASSDHFYIRSIDGTIIPYAFDASTMTASRIEPSSTGNGGLTILSQVEPQFSFLSSNLLFGSRQDPLNDWPIIRQFDFNTRTYADISNLGAVTIISPGTYAGALSSSSTTPEMVCVLFGGVQDTHYKVAVLPVSPAGAGPVVLDTQASTITTNGATASTNIPLGVFLHHAWMDQSGRYVVLYTVNQQPVPYYVWDLATNMITGVNSNAGGHDATGFRRQINQACCTTTAWDAAQWQSRGLGNPGTTTDLIDPVLTPQAIYLADHTSWNNAQPGTLVPILSSLYRYYSGTYNTTPWRAWDDEIVAIETDAERPSATVWRFAHHRSDVSYDGDATRAFYFWYLPNAVISPNGRWAIFTSNWEKSLGAAVDSDVQPGGTYRSDVFLVALAQAVAVDTTPPTTSATATPGPNSSGWNNTNVTVVLSAVDNDEGSGVNQIIYALSGGAQSGASSVVGSRTSLTISAEGDTILTYFASDNTGNLETTKTLTIRIDKTPPTVTCGVSPSLLRPANHRLVSVVASVAVKDQLSGVAGFGLNSVTSNEPDRRTDSGDVPNDIQGFVVGTPDTSGQLRAERSPAGSGRVYTLTYTGIDAAGNRASCTSTVSVPHDQ
jgi:hypothetical protein